MFQNNSPSHLLGRFMCFGASFHHLHFSSLFVMVRFVYFCFVVLVFSLYLSSLPYLLSHFFPSLSFPIPLSLSIGWHLSLPSSISSLNFSRRILFSNGRCSGSAFVYGLSNDLPSSALFFLFLSQVVML